MPRRRSRSGRRARRRKPSHRDCGRSRAVVRGYLGPVERSFAPPLTHRALTRVDHRPFRGVELHEVETTEGHRVLVLSTAGEPHVDAFDLVGEAGDLIFSQWQGGYAGNLWRTVGVGGAA